jgi:hypothetical protein
VSFPDDQITELKELFGEVQQRHEGGVTYFFLPQLRLPDGCTPAQIDALFCPTSHHGYTARLFFAERINSPKSLNWNTNQRILERNWHAFSWEIKQGNLRLAQVVAIILGALR